MTPLVYAFLLTLPAFGGVEIEVKTKTPEACASMRSLVNKQLLLAGVRYTLTDCVKK